MVFGDCAVNVSPSAQDLALIASSSADTAAAFGISPPLVAMLSYSTGTSLDRSSRNPFPAYAAPDNKLSRKQILLTVGAVGRVDVLIMSAKEA